MLLQINHTLNSSATSPVLLSPSSTPLRPRTRIKNLNKALRVLNLISRKKPKPNLSQSRRKHLRLIEDSLKAHKKQSFENPFSNYFITSSSSSTGNPFNLVHISYSSREGDSIYMFCDELRRKGLIFDAAVALHALSACGVMRNPNCGFQLHCLAIRNEGSTNVYVGSSLIRFYKKCGELNIACKVFEEMPARNAVLWTALMSGFAQEWRIDECVKLYYWMSISNHEPNHFISPLQPFLVHAWAVVRLRGEGVSVVKPLSLDLIHMFLQLMRSPPRTVNAGMLLMRPVCSRGCVAKMLLHGTPRLQGIHCTNLK